MSVRIRRRVRMDDLRTGGAEGNRTPRGDDLMGLLGANTHRPISAHARIRTEDLLLSGGLLYPD